MYVVIKYFIKFGRFDLSTVNTKSYENYTKSEKKLKFSEAPADWERRGAKLQLI